MGTQEVLVLERTPRRAFSVVFEEEEVVWILKLLKKAVELKAILGFIQKFRGRLRTRLMEICFSSRGRFIRILEFLTGRKATFFIVLEGFKGSGLGSPYEVNLVCGGAAWFCCFWSSESEGSKALARLLGVKGVISITPFTTSKVTVHFEELKVDWNTLRPVDLTKARVKVEMNLNVVLPTLLEVIDGAWFFTVAVSVVGGEEDEQLKPVLTHCRSELASTGGGMWQYPLQSRRTHGEAKTSEGNNCRPPSQVSISNFNGITNWADFSKEEVAHAVGDLGPFEEEDPSLPKALLVKSFEARLCEGKACTGGSPFHTNKGSSLQKIQRSLEKLREGLCPVLSCSRDVPGRAEGAFDLALSTLPPTIALQSRGLKMASLPLPFNSSCYPFSSVADPSRVNKSQLASIGVVSSPKGVVSSKVKPNQELEGRSFHSLSQNNLSDSFSLVRCLLVESCLPQMEDFEIEGISPSKLASIKLLGQ
ncbi:hypothetical protein CK203_079510 [Vitis vinifera]|uniref:DUF4283 domain-containing protein n=1 Tax=Vitis vinifera TaxID=29760 RepID=A0A438CNU3_VITVI|nr:hypothetical protein CK203_079510 [Vitis vinifera]